MVWGEEWREDGRDGGGEGFGQREEKRREKGGEREEEEEGKRARESRPGRFATEWSKTPGKYGGGLGNLDGGREVIRGRFRRRRRAAIFR